MTSTTFSSFLLPKSLHNPPSTLTDLTPHRPTALPSDFSLSVPPRQQKCSRVGKEDAGNQLSDAFPLPLGIGELGVED